MGGYDLFENYNLCHAATCENKFSIFKDKYEKNILFAQLIVHPEVSLEMFLIYGE